VVRTARKPVEIPTLEQAEWISNVLGLSVVWETRRGRLELRPFRRVCEYVKGKKGKTLYEVWQELKQKYDKARIEALS
jgi:hypothetical protein